MIEVVQGISCTVALGGEWSKNRSYVGNINRGIPLSIIELMCPCMIEQLFKEYDSYLVW